MEKLYYSISEVASEAGIALSHLRFLETKFPQLRPKRNAKGTRFYTAGDLQLVKNIVYLRNKQHITLKGTKEILEQRQDDISAKQEITERLQNVRQTLIGICKNLN